MMKDSGKESAPSRASTQLAGTALGPFRHATFSVLWLATVIATVGTWLYNTASAWLMTELEAEPLTVSLIQVATSLPLFLFALPAGALADIVDKRRLLIIGESAITAIYAFFAMLVWWQLVSAGTLLIFTFLIAAGGAVASPAWQSIVTELVPKRDLSSAVTANSAGINVSRAVGPALGGLMIAGFGIAAPFWLNAVGNLGVVGALLWWRSPRKVSTHLPAEHFAGAIRAGARFAKNNLQLRATLMRAAAFFLFAVVYWALLPLVARSQIAGGPQVYGVLLGAIGAGAVGGAFAVPRLIASLGADRLVTAGTLGTVAALALFGLAHDVITALAASLAAGLSWIAVLSSLTVSAQVALPEWVRGRGLAMFIAVSYGAMTLGAPIWGKVAAIAGLPAAHFIAAACALAVLPLTWRWKLPTGLAVDLTPSMHWPAPITAHEIAYDRGPVMVTVEYRIDRENRGAFLAALEQLAHQRRGDGAYAWGVFEDTAEDGRYLETFLVQSWLEHLRQHERVTMAERALENAVSRFQREGTPKVTHLIAAERNATDARAHGEK